VGTLQGEDNVFGTVPTSDILKPAPFAPPSALPGVRVAPGGLAVRVATASRREGAWRFRKKVLLFATNRETVQQVHAVQQPRFRIFAHGPLY
jgi:hypothetical protein